MKGRPRVSIVIPLYESASWIEETLQSVLRQRYSADYTEVIVVDDASRDGGAEIARRLLETSRIESVVVDHRENRGPAAARNTGLDRARGDFIQFLDADDLLAPHKIALQAALAARAQPSVAVVYSSWQEYRFQDAAWGPHGPLHQPFVDDDPVLAILAQPTFWFLGPTLIRRTALERVGGFVEERSLGEDMDMLLRLAMGGAGFREARSDTAALFYRQWASSLSRSYLDSDEALRNLCSTLDEAEAFLRERNGGELAEQAREVLYERRAGLSAFLASQGSRTGGGRTSWLDAVGRSCPVRAWPPRTDQPS